MTYNSNSEDDTYKVGRELAGKVKPGDVFLVEGTLGAGKSVLIRGIAAGLGVDENMPSPTFTLVNEYATSREVPLYHFDFYRLDDPFELYEIGFEDYVYSRGISFIEWPSKGGELIPEQAIRIEVNIVDEEGQEREIKIEWNR